MVPDCNLLCYESTKFSHLGEFPVFVKSQIDLLSLYLHKLFKIIFIISHTKSIESLNRFDDLPSLDD